MSGDIYSFTGLILHQLYPRNIAQKQVKINDFETSANDFDFGTVTVQVFFCTYVRDKNCANEGISEKASLILRCFHHFKVKRFIVVSGYRIVMSVVGSSSNGGRKFRLQKLKSCAKVN